MTTHNTLEELLKIAEAATPGPRHQHGLRLYGGRPCVTPNEWQLMARLNGNHANHRADIRFLEEFNPAVAKALVRGMQALQEISSKRPKGEQPTWDFECDNHGDIASNAYDICAWADADLADAALAALATALKEGK